MRLFRKEISGTALALIAVMLSAGIVYAAQYYQVNNGGSSRIDEWGTCGQIANNSGQGVFVPTNSSAEWSAFRSHLPSGVTNSACCAANYGQGCTSGANACGQTNSGTYDCAGACSASVPANPPGYGDACTSAPNSCGQTNNGTIQCNGTCSASTPSEGSCPVTKHYYIALGSYSDGPEYLDCTIYFTDGSNWSPGTVTSGPPSYYGPYSTTATYSSYSCTPNWMYGPVGDYWDSTYECSTADPYGSCIAH